MPIKYVSQANLTRVITKVKALIAGKADSGHSHSAATTSAAGFMSAADKSKLDGITTGANKITVDSALSSSSTNPVQNKVINSALAGKANSSHSHDAATQSAAGYMSADDKKKLDGIATGATKITVDTGLSSTSTNPVQNKVINSALAGKANSSHSHGISDVSGLQSALDGKAESGHSHSEATTGAAGLMSAADKSKLDGIAKGANKITVDSALSSSSTNPVQNKVINTALAGKANSSHDHTVATTAQIDEIWNNA